MKNISTFSCITLFIFSALHSFSQAPAKQWDADFGGDQNEQCAAAQQTKDGGYIAGGYSESGISGDVTQDNRGSSDYWIVKTNANGLKQWDARFGGTSVDQLTCLQQTTDGGYILGGISFSGVGGDKTQPSQGSSDYWIVKINANGAKQWDARFGGSSFDELHSLQQTADGGYILGGSSFSGISGDKTQESRGGKDFWIVKTDSVGVKEWDARFGGTAFEELFSVRQTKEGGYILGGYSLSGISGDKTDPSHGRFDFWVVKTKADGVKQWDATYGGKDDDWLAQLRQTTDGGYILGGWSWSGSSGDKSQRSKGANDYWIIKTDNNGVRQWDAAFGGNSNDYLNAVEQTADGGYVLGGYSSSPVSGDKTQETEGGTDYWMVKTNAGGKKQWDADFGGTDFDFLSALQQTNDGGYILAGYSASNAGGNKTQNSKGLNDYWLVKTTADGESCNIPTNLQTVNIQPDQAKLKWDTVAGVIGYNINYRIQGSTEWTSVNTENNFKKLQGLFSGTPYEWRVRSVCSKPSAFSGWSARQSFFTPFSVAQAANSTTLTAKNSFGEVYPNPVSESATISFLLTKASRVTIVLNDAHGRTIKLITDNNFSEGAHKISFDARSLSAGVYFLQVKNDDQVLTKKIIVAHG